MTGWRIAGADHDGSEFEVMRLLKDRLTRPTKWARLAEGSRIDTRRGTTLLSIERGGIALALPHARAKAQYAIAVWTILAPPARRRVLPDLGVWVPQPYLRFRQTYKRHEQVDGVTREMNRGAASTHGRLTRRPTWTRFGLPSKRSSVAIAAVAKRP